jgi:hypothetical protein
LVKFQVPELAAFRGPLLFQNLLRKGRTLVGNMRFLSGQYDFPAVPALAKAQGNLYPCLACAEDNDSIIQLS